MSFKTWTAVSTHKGEYEQILTAQTALKSVFSNIRLAVCPRYPQTIESVKKLFKKDPTVIFNETLGNMEPYFEMADIVFVGGTFSKTGGHNILEPVSRKKPTIVGPYTDKIEDLIEACGSIIRVQNGAELGEKLIELFSDQTKCRSIAETGYANYLKSREGVLESYLALIVPIIDAELARR